MSTKAAAPSFVGRDHAVNRVHELLAGTRLLTLTGPGGIGKTRLAAAVAQQPLAWCDLVPVGAPALVPSALAAAAGIRSADEQELLAALADRSGVLVIDNAEHVLEAVADLAARLLEHASGPHVLVTSREPLGIRGETTWRVPPLAVPDTAAQAPPDELARNPSVRLFLDRARAAAPDLTLDIAAVARICTRLDGIPLALELAAARLRALPPDALAAQLDASLGVLAAPRGAQPRHRTLRATLDRSHELLDEPERAVLRRLAVFASSFTVDAATAVACDESLSRHRVGELVASLVDRSLVQPPEPDGRLRLLVPVRQYARELLEASGESAAVARRHAERLRDLAEEVEPLLRGARQLESHHRIAAEYDDIAAALEWALRERDPVAVRLAGALGMWWYRFSSRFADAEFWLERALAMAAPADPAAAAGHARCLLWSGWLRFDGGDLETAETRLQAASERFAAKGDRWHVGLIAALLASVAAAREDDGEARARFAVARAALAGVDEAESALGVAAVCEAEFLRSTGDSAGAIAANELAASCFEAAGDDAFLATVRQNLGHLRLGEHDGAAAAAALFAQALEYAFDARVDWLLAYPLAGLGRVAGRRGEHVRAARLFGFAAALLRRAGSRLDPPDQRDIDATAAVARRQLGGEAYDDAFAAGARWSREEAVEEARAVRAARGPRERSDSPLTPRQREVAALVARGLSNREVAAELTISVHTAERHVEHILAALNLRSRAQVAGWVATNAAKIGSLPDGSGGPRS